MDKSTLRRTLPMFVATILTGAAPLPAASGNPGADAAAIFAQTAVPTARVRSYTASLRADVQMKSFPFVSFHLSGKISYRRPNLLSVHFDHVPWFAKGFDNIAMDELEPSTWLGKYEVVSLDRGSDITSVQLREKKQHSILSSILASIGADGLRTMRWTYTSGEHIDYSVARSEIDGVPLPQSEDAEIQRTLYHIVVHATLSDYEVVLDPPAGGEAG